MKSTPLFLLIGFIFVSSLVLNGCRSGEQASKPNIVFFIADDMYPHMFNCLSEGKGENLTPNLDWLASEGTLMMNQYVV